MKHPNLLRSPLFAVVLLALLLCLLWAPDAAGKPPPPTSRTYFAVSMGLFAPFDLDTACVRFKKRKVCFADGMCGRWGHTEDAGAESGFWFEIETEAAGMPIEIRGSGRVDDRAPEGALSMVGELSFDGTEINFAFAAQPTTRRECQRMAADFAPIATEWAHARCLRRAEFGDPAASPYILPFREGEGYRVSQSYCDPQGRSHRSKFAYDFDTPIGTPIIAARDGVVWHATDEFEDGDQTDSHENTVWIEHADGTVAYYSHLRHESLRVEPGDTVVAGQIIAESGDTGTNSPHLHFQVQKSRSQSEGDSVPVSFRNTIGDLDSRGGLLPGVVYTAGPV